MSIVSPTILTEQQITEITNYINNLRNKHNSPPLTWDNEIGIYAQNWAKYLLDNNLFKHSNSTLYSENLASFSNSNGIGSDMVSLIKQSIDMWYNEISLYDFTKNEFSSATGHFTALVWKSSTKYGMGIALNNNQAIITFNAFPQGNIIGNFKDNVLPPTTIIIKPPPITPTPVPTPVPIPTPVVIIHYPITVPRRIPSYYKQLIIQILNNIINDINNNTDSNTMTNKINDLIVAVYKS
jgi:hypothetical protein